MLATAVGCFFIQCHERLVRAALVELGRVFFEEEIQ